MHVLIRRSDQFALEMNQPLEELLKWPPVSLLLEACMAPPMCENLMDLSPAGRLKVWLDAFYVRGEFDDRTLVIMHRGALV
jgi:hypothetical protein